MSVVLNGNNIAVKAEIVDVSKLGSKTITENGTYNAENDNLNGYSSVEVNVQPNLQEKSIIITENGTTEVVADNGYDGLAKVSIEANVQDNRLLNAIKGLTSGSTTQTKFELTPDMFDQTITFIQQYRFYGNRALTNVETPNNITRIYKYAFSETYTDKIVILPKVIDIGERCFSSAGITQISMPMVEEIGGYAFMNNSNLTQVAIPNVNTIGDWAFNECYYLTLVDFRGRTKTTIPTLQSTSFRYVPTTCKFIIPDSLYDSWIASTNWVSLYNKGYQFIKASEYTEA